MSGDEGAEPGQEPVGSFGEEAARLVGALSGWFTQGVAHVGHDVGEGVDDLLSQLRGAASRAVHDLDEHLSTGSAECRVCPLCRTVHALREVTPEVRGHLADAATSMTQAALGLAAALAAEAAAHGGGRGHAEDASAGGSGTASPSDGVQHIDLDPGSGTEQ